MHLVSSLSSRALPLVAGVTIIVVVASRRAPPSLEPRIDLAVACEAEPAPVPDCGTWPYDLSLRDAMQTCSMWSTLATNEKWVFGVEAAVVDHKVVDVTITSVEYSCVHCVEYDGEGRADRARQTLGAITACMLDELADARFEDASCTFRTVWSIRNDW